MGRDNKKVDIEATKMTKKNEGNNAEVEGQRDFLVLKS